MFRISEFVHLDTKKKIVTTRSRPLSQGMLTLLSKCIDRMNLYNSAAHFGEMAGEEAGAAWKDILNLLYELLGKWAWVMNHMKYPHLLSALSAVDPR